MTEYFLVATEFGANAKRIYVVTEFLEICFAREYILLRDREFKDMKSSMSRHSVKCRDSEARRCVALRRGTLT